jgi:prepilin-type N-terminal cleavage/methylation domain-containing protein
MITNKQSCRARSAGFTLVEVMISMTIVVVTIGLAMSTFLFGLRTMYKDTQRLASNGSLRKFMTQISDETLNASYFYVFPYYTSLDGNVNITTPITDLAAPTQSFNHTNDLYDQWVAHGDCLVLVTLTSLYRTTDIRQIRIYYRTTKDQNTTAGQNLNAEAHLRYYETDDWGEGPAPTSPITVGASNGHLASSLVGELNSINLNLTPTLTGSRLITARSLGRKMISPPTDRFPIFSTFSPSASPTTGCVSINIEFINGTTANNMLSSSSFNYTIAPKR